MQVHDSYATMLLEGTQISVRKPRERLLLLGNLLDVALSLTINAA